jgi:exonuclease SbcC
MRIVNFLKVGLENFCCHIDPIELVFKNGEIILLTGPNGTGKTALIQSIPFTLYGVCEKGRSEDVLNNKINKDCHTFVEFNIDDQIYRVDRYVKCKNIGTSVTLIKNGDAYKKGQKEVLPEIEKLVMPRNLFFNTLLFCKKAKTFFTELVDSEQKEIFRKIIKLDNYVLYQKEASRRNKQIEIDMSNLSPESKVTETLIQDNKQQIEYFQNEHSEFDSEKKKHIKFLLSEIQNVINKNLINDLRLLDEKISPEKHEMLLNEISRLTQTLEVIDQDIETNIFEVKTKKRIKEEEINLTAKEYNMVLLKEKTSNKDNLDSYYKDKKESLDDQIKNITLKVNAKMIDENTLFHNIESSIKEKKQYSLLNEKICPTCEQEISEVTIKRLVEVVSKIDLNIQSNQKNIDDIKQNLYTLNQERELFESHAETENKTYQENLYNLTTKYTNEEIQISNRLKEALNNLEEIENKEKKKVYEESLQRKESLQQNLSKLNTEMEEIKDIIEKRKKLVEQVTEMISLYKQKINMLCLKKQEEFDTSYIIICGEKQKQLQLKREDIYNKITDLDKKYKSSSFWLDGFSAKGIQSMLIDESIPFMNNSISDFLDKLSNGRYIATFDTLKSTKEGELRDKISVNVFDNQTHANSQVNLSGGQKRLVDIAIILTLFKLQSVVQDVSFNILLFDEVFDSLDNENISSTMNLLKTLKEYSITIISHNYIDIQADVELELKGKEGAWHHKI